MRYPLPPELCFLSEVSDDLSVPMPPFAEAARLSKVDRFPRYVRIGGRKSEPAFRRDEIMEWIRQTYSELLPERVAEIEQSGFLNKKDILRHGDSND